MIELEGCFKRCQPDLIDPQCAFHRIAIDAGNEFLAADNESGLGSAKQLVAREGDEVCSIRNRFSYRRLMFQAEACKVDERTGAQIIDERDIMLMGECREISRRYIGRESFDAVVRGVDLEDEGGFRSDRIDVVLWMCPVGGADLDQLRSGAAHDLRHAKGATDLDELATRDDRFTPLGKSVEHQEDGCGIVIDERRILSTRELDEEATQVIVAFGDSITDGTGSTLNGDDRWPDVLARRLHATAGNRFAVVNAGIGGNRVISPADYATNPINGGPPAVDRLERDVLTLSGVSTVIWLEGINDFGATNATAKEVSDGVREAVLRMRERVPGLRIFMATVPSALNSTPTHGTAEVDARRNEYNNFIRTSGIFDGVIDFDAVALDPATGGMRAEYQPNSTIGGPGDKLHPNRAGYAAMGNAIDLTMIVGK